jgi:hypothetical protein
MHQIDGIRHRGPECVKHVILILVLCVVGRGTQDDPVRNIEQYWDFNGKKLFEIDRWLIERKRSNENTD